MLADIALTGTASTEEATGETAMETGTVVDGEEMTGGTATGTTVPMADTTKTDGATTGAGGVATTSTAEDTMMAGETAAVVEAEEAEVGVAAEEKVRPTGGPPLPKASLPFRSARGRPLDGTSMPLDMSNTQLCRLSKLDCSTSLEPTEHKYLPSSVSPAFLPQFLCLRSAWELAPTPICLASLAASTLEALPPM